MVRPVEQLLCSFAEKPMCLARFSRSAHLDAAVVHVGEGTRPEHYAGCDVAGKLVLAWGTPNAVAQEAIWTRGAAGLLWYRTEGRHETPEATQVVYTLQWQSYAGQPLTFGFSLSYQARHGADAAVGSRPGGGAPRERGRPGVRLPNCGSPPACCAASKQPEQEIWVLGHCDHRNTAGINNLTGHGASLGDSTCSFPAYPRRRAATPAAHDPLLLGAGAQRRRPVPARASRAPRSHSERDQPGHGRDGPGQDRRQADHAAHAPFGAPLRERCGAVLPRPHRVGQRDRFSECQHPGGRRRHLGVCRHRSWRPPAAVPASTRGSRSSGGRATRRI